MFSRYLITEKHISDAINAFHNDNYTNPTVTTQAFKMSTKIVYQKLDGKASKSLRSLSNKALSLEQEQKLKDYIQ